MNKTELIHELRSKAAVLPMDAWDRGHSAGLKRAADFIQAQLDDDNAALDMAFTQYRDGFLAWMNEVEFSTSHPPAWQRGWRDAEACAELAPAGALRL